MEPAKSGRTRRTARSKVLAPSFSFHPEVRSRALLYFLGVFFGAFFYLDSLHDEKSGYLVCASSPFQVGKNCNQFLIGENSRTSRVVCNFFVRHGKETDVFNHILKDLEE